MSTSWSYRVLVGDPGVTDVLDWETTSDERTGTPDLTTGGVPGLVLDGLTLARRLPEDEPWPCQPNPTVLTFQVAALTATELAQALRLGVPVAYRLGQLDDADDYQLCEAFAGYISDVQLEARDGHTVATVTAMEWWAALAEVIIGDEPWPLEAAQNRLNTVATEVFQNAPELPYEWDYAPGHAPAAGQHLALAAADVDARPALDVILEILRCWALGAIVNPRDGTISRYQLRTVTAATELDWTEGWNAVPGAESFHNTLIPLSWELVARTVAPNNMPPALLGEVSPGVWGVLMDPLTTDDSTAVHGDAVELSMRWARRIGQIPNTAVVVVPFAGYTAGQGRYTLRWSLPQAERKPRVRIKREVPIEFSTPDDATYMSGVDAAFLLAFLLIPNTMNRATAWGTDELVWRASMEDGYWPWPFKLGELLTVTDVDPDTHPTSSAWVHGQLDGYTMRITDGMPVVTFTTRPQLRDTIHPEALELANVPAGLTLAELDPTMTLHDLRLLRNP